MFVNNVSKFSHFIIRTSSSCPGPLYIVDDKVVQEQILLITVGKRCHKGSLFPVFLLTEYDFFELSSVSLRSDS